ncbi:unnamed protein product [marine sediment metagenome]|uniref:Uncharacterized protein n=1 Tax=marine sediment metagenome TaxID=412755 RepID=X1CE86_9ZZZZ
MKDIVPEGYEGYFNWSWPIWTILIVTLLLSLLFAAFKTRGPKEVSGK